MHPALRILKGSIKRRFPGLVAYRSLIMNPDSYLHSTGWIESIRRSHPCASDGRDLPWMNYAIIEFMEQRLTSGLSLFEYGSGHSTLFYAKLVKSVASVDHDKGWHEALLSKVPANVQLIFRSKDEDGGYCRAISHINMKYDVAIVDGVDRVNCIKQCIPCLSPRGVIVLDDSQRLEYVEGIQFAKDAGFRALDFQGMKPTGPGIEKTTLFYRPGNCFEI